MPIGEGVARRELHFFFVCDCSGSMADDGKIQALNEAIRLTGRELQDRAKENPGVDVMMRVLSFSDDAVWNVAQPTPLDQFRWTGAEELRADGLTHLHKALDKLAEAFKNLPGRMLRPVLVLISDGQASEAWDNSLAAFTTTYWGGRSIRLAVAIGKDADRDELQRFIGNREIKVVDANSPQALIEKVRWMSVQAVTASGKSQNVNDPGPAGQTILTGEPPDVEDDDEWLDS